MDYWVRLIDVCTLSLKTSRTLNAESIIEIIIDKKKYE